MEKGKFIVVEGIDGSGKSTAVEYLVNYIEDHYNIVKVLRKKEPTLSYIGDIIRGILGGFVTMPPKSIMASLFAADRFFHTEEIKEGLKDGFHVICDRYIWSNLAYNTEGDKEVQSLLNLHKDWYLAPDYLIYLGTSPRVALDRIIKRGNENSFDTFKVISGAELRYRDALSKRYGFGDHTQLCYINTDSNLELSLIHI